MDIILWIQEKLKKVKYKINKLKIKMTSLYGIFSNVIVDYNFTYDSSSYSLQIPTYQPIDYANYIDLSSKGSEMINSLDNTLPDNENNNNELSSLDAKMGKGYQSNYSGHIHNIPVHKYDSRFYPSQRHDLAHDVAHRRFY